MRVLLLGFGARQSVVEAAEGLRPEIERRAEVVLCDFTGREDVSGVEADYAIVFGGDGSILRAAHQMGRRQLPVIAVNLGRLGFLADLSPAELPALLDRLADGHLEVVEHLMINCQVFRHDRLVYEELGLNEVAVQNGAPFAIMEVDLYVDSELVTTYSCDGLIIATPVGSTAHSLSAGGPILRKDLQAVVIAPISPHTLTHRPVVDSADRLYELVVPRPTAQTSVVVDGRVICTLRPEDRVRVRRAEERFQLVAAPGHSYYRTLREKLGWSGRFQMDKSC
ncbi:MAG TPA: NAD(+)/NADH kinase [Planctomycetaceae bacterium]|nr:NAD(+)/NADH kinase [Planctomycetaceae bacterium]HIQ22492.1 NAD(+)/NADH kinase [Planctomycetota bacterium]